MEAAPEKDWNALLDIARAAAGAAVRRLSSPDSRLRNPTLEANHDVKLRADQEAEGVILDLLSRESSLPVLSEERGGVFRSDGGWRWIVDPLDGTINYQRGIPLCGVSIGLWFNMLPVLGVIWEVKGGCYSGIAGLGATVDGVPLQVSVVSQISAATLCTGFPASMAHDSERVSAFVKSICSFRKIRLLGSAALSLAWLAQGRVDAYAEESIQIWDVAGGLALVSAAGGRFGVEVIEGTSLRVTADNGHLIWP